jgi:hypothetical protein
VSVLNPEMNAHSEVVAAPSYHRRTVSTKFHLASELLDVAICSSVLCARTSELPLTYIVVSAPTSDRRESSHATLPAAR